MNHKKIILCVFISIFLLLIIKLVLQSSLKQDKLKVGVRNALELEFPKPLNVENQQINIENWATVNSEEGNIIREMIKQTHSKCPVMGDHKPYVSVCVQDPKTNQGYVISLCCNHCLGKIQESLKLNDNKFSIRELNHVNVLYYKDEPKQIAVPCNRLNLEGVMKLVGTRLM